MEASAANIKTERLSMSDHDYFVDENGVGGAAGAENQNDLMDQDVDVVTADDRADIEQEHPSNHPKRNVKKQVPYNIAHHVIKKKTPSAPSSSKRPSARSSGKKNSSGKAQLKLKLKRRVSDNTKYEVDYIFGKRPDKEREGKYEFRVRWKGYSQEDSTWEPEDGLRGAKDSIQAYERSVGAGVEYKSDEDGEEEQDAMGVEPEQQKVTIRKKAAPIKRNSSGNRAKSASKSKPKKEEVPKPKPLATMRARTRSISPTPMLSNKTTNARVKQERAVSKFSNKETSPEQSQSSQASSVRTRANNNKMAGSSVPSTSSRASNESGQSLRAQNIVMVAHVRKSSIEGLSYVAEVILKDGNRKEATLAHLKEICPELVFDYYERQMGLVGV